MNESIEEVVAEYKLEKNQYLLSLQKASIKGLEYRNLEMKKRNTTNIFLFILIVLFLLIIVFLITIKFKKNAQINKYRYELLQTDLEEHKRKLHLFKNNLLDKQRFVSKLKDRYFKLIQKEGKEEKEEKEATNDLRFLDGLRIVTKEDWDNFKTLFIKTYPGFYRNLLEEHDDLTEGELRLCFLIILDFSSSQIADINCVSLLAVKKSRYRLRKKLNIEEDQVLNSYLISFQE